LQLLIEVLEELNIPILEDKYKNKEKSISIARTKLGESYWDDDAIYNHMWKHGTQNNEDTTVRNLSPQLGETEEWNTPEQSNSEDSSLSDSDKTLVGDAPESTDIQSHSWHDRTYKISKQFEIENWDIDDSDYYFRATPYIDSRQQKCTF